MTDEPTDDTRARIYQHLARQEAKHALAVQESEHKLSEVIEAVLSRWRQWWAPPSDSMPTLAIASKLDLKFRLCFPLAAHSLNHVDTCWPLHQALPWVAESGARVAFEHALTTQWVLLTEGGETLLKAQMDRASFIRREKYVNSVRRLSAHPDAAAVDAHGFDDDDLVALIGERPSGGRANFEQLCRRFAAKETADLFYDISRSLSEAVHPSWGLVHSYLTFDADWDPRGLDWTGSSGESFELSRSLAISGLWALYALELCRDGQPNVKEILAIGERAGLPVDLRASDQQPEMQPAINRYWH